MNADSKIDPSLLRYLEAIFLKRQLNRQGQMLQKQDLKDVISLEVADFKDLKATDENGFLFLNPPYGQRLQPDETDSFIQYDRINTEA